MCSTCDSKEKKGGNGSLQYKFGSSFLGSNVLGSDPDFNLEYMDLDEFLQENGIPLVDEELAHSDSPMQYRSPQQLRHSSAVLSAALVVHQPQSTIIMTTPPSSPYTSSSSSSSSTSSPPPQASHSTAAWWSSSPPVSPVIAEVPFTISPQDLQLVTIPGQDEFDPRKRVFSEEELKPQPLIKKSQKVFVVDDLKDDKYWNRRNKNNTAAKRSRNARRLKENQIAMRAAFLEKENSIMKEQMDTMVKENSQLKQRLLKYEFHNVAN